MYSIYVEDVAFTANELKQFANKMNVNYVVEGFNEEDEWFEVTFTTNDLEVIQDVAFTFCMNDDEIKTI